MAKSQLYFLWILPLISCEQRVNDPSTYRASSFLFEEADGNAVTPTLLQASISLVDPNGSILESQVQGELDEAQIFRITRPASYTDDPHVYLEEAWSEPSREDPSLVERGYRAYRIPNEAPKPLPTSSGLTGPASDQAILHQIAQLPADEPIQVSILVADFPEWNIPLRPDQEFLPASAEKSYLDARERAFEERRNLFSALTQTVRQFALSLGASVDSENEHSGWLSFSLPAGAVAELAEHDDVVRLVWLEKNPDVYSGPLWPLGDSQTDARIGQQRYFFQSYDGGIGNPSRHSHGRIGIGITEIGGYAVDACAFKDGSGCTGADRWIDTYPQRCKPRQREGGLMPSYAA